MTEAKISRDEYERLIAAGWNDRQIAEAHGIALKTFQRKRLRWGYRMKEPAPKITTITEDKLRQLKEEQGLTDAQVAEMFGVSATTIKQRRQQWGIAAYGRTAGPRKPTREEMQAYKDAELTDEEIADAIGWSASTVARWRREYGIEGNMSITTFDRRHRENIQKVIDLRKRGLRIAEIANEIGVAPETISNWLPSKLRRNPDHVDTQFGQRVVYDWIVWYKAKYGGNSPSIVELSGLCNMSDSTVRKFVKALEKRRKIQIFKPTATTTHIAIVGEQWLPPSNVKVLTQPPRWERPSRSGRKRLINAERKSKVRNGYRTWYCDCGNEASHVLMASVRIINARSDDSGWLPLCRDCADLAEQDKETILPITVSSEWEC